MRGSPLSSSCLPFCRSRAALAVTSGLLVMSEDQPSSTRAAVLLEALGRGRAVACRTCACLCASCMP